ncbi:unnamed protein product [Chironomus riparius]|uniref:Alpha-ketoglutarate-dependent dioxygenase alkB homolog 7, mitochondrial n=1 Tax=Chironomus riparius TaxID=315576 RepID=A0A9N9RT46_9DIPT|nr:unnamed protein product [Chironomus riparius]
MLRNLLNIARTKIKWDNLFSLKSCRSCSTANDITRLKYDPNDVNSLMEFEGIWPEDAKEQFIKDMRVVESFISDKEEQEILTEIEPYLKRLKYERDHWDDAINVFRETERKSWYPQNRTIINRLIQTAFKKDASTLPHIHVLDLAADGVIKPHVDSVRFCGSTISGLSLLSDAVMKLVQSTTDPFEAPDEYRQQPKVDTSNLYSCKVLLRRRSLYIMSNSARYNFTHELLSNEESIFKGQTVEKGRRISIICREEP